jgi:hypothetical protein
MKIIFTPEGNQWNGWKQKTRKKSTFKQQQMSMVWITKL